MNCFGAVMSPLCTPPLVRFQQLGIGRHKVVVYIRNDMPTGWCIHTQDAYTVVYTYFSVVASEAYHIAPVPPSSFPVQYRV